MQRVPLPCTWEHRTVNPGNRSPRAQGQTPLTEARVAGTLSKTLLGGHLEQIQGTRQLEMVGTSAVRT